MKKANKLKTFLKYIVLVLLVIVFLFPVIYMLASSVMSPKEIAQLMDFSKDNYASLSLIPKEFSLEQFYQVFFRRPDYLLKFWNSVVVTFPTVLGQVVVSALAAFAFGKLNFKGRDKLFFVYIILLILPLQVTLVPNYIILDQMNLLNNFLAVILPGTFTAFGICLLRQSIRYIPSASIEAAKVDGASYLKIFFKIILPQMKGGIITLILLCFIDNWNAVEQPLIYFNNTAMYPLSVGLSNITANDNGIIFACGVMFMIPALLIYFMGEKEFVSPFAIGINKS